MRHGGNLYHSPSQQWRLFGHIGSGSMQLILMDREGLLFGHSALWFASLLGMYSVIKGKGLFAHSVLVALIAGKYLAVREREGLQGLSVCIISKPNIPINHGRATLTLSGRMPRVLSTSMTISPTYWHFVG